MFRAIVETQWKWTRGIVLVATIAAFSIPMAAIAIARAAVDGPGGGTFSVDTFRFVTQISSTGVFYSMTAAGLGLAVAMAAWAHDHRGKHIYALALPVARWRYALMRLGAGGLFLIPPVVGLLAGGSLVAVSGAVPAGLHAYPVAIALRFALAALVAYSVFFAVSASTPRTAGIILGTMAGVVMVQFVLETTGSHTDVIQPLVDGLFGQGGVLSVFTGRWMLIDA